MATLRPMPTDKPEMCIDITGVPNDKWNRADFIALRNDMQAALSNPIYINAFCMHEAGHIIYFSRVGLTEFECFGPRIIYDAGTDAFTAYAAEVQPRLSTLDPENFSLVEYMAGLAQACAAGGVFASVIVGAENDIGDEQDREVFGSICEMFQSEHQGAVDQAGAWASAQDAVRQELRNPAFRREAWEKALEIKARLFGRS